MNSKLTGHLACAAAYTIFGLNIVFCKDIANAVTVSPEALFGIRMFVAAGAFWLMSLFVKEEKVPAKDVFLMALAGIIGLVLPQYTFLKGITMCSSIDCSILGSLTPLWAMIFAAIFLGEPITGKKVLGVVTSLAGALLLIFSSLHFKGGLQTSTPAGIALILANCFTFGAYLGIFRPLTQRYSIVTLMKWMFLFSMVVAIPLSLKPIMTIDYAAVTPKLAMEVVYVVVFATIVAYFLIPAGQRRLRPTVVSMYTYLQPIIAVVVSIIAGMDTLTWQKLLAVALVFVGVWIVNKSRAAHAE
ncbi:MAG: DMT family transporter [Bacteroidales bacterium]|nr:DMT family transporter [Bacteroidales bacterium]MBR5670757.1 DMT family transporter [Bacteroidales bacterium]